jgi:hypothetical protein
MARRSLARPDGFASSRRPRGGKARIVHAITNAGAGGQGKTIEQGRNALLPSPFGQSKFRLTWFCAIGSE